MASPAFVATVMTVGVFVAGGLAFTVLYYGIRAAQKVTDTSVLLARRHELLARADAEHLSEEEMQKIVDLTAQLRARLTLPEPSARLDEEWRTAVAAKRARQGGNWDVAKSLLATLGRRKI